MTVEICESTVVIHDIEIREVNIVAAFHAAFDAGRDPDDFLRLLIELGTQVATLGFNSAGAEKIEASIEQARQSIKDVAESVESTVIKQVAQLTSQDGALAKGVNEALAKLLTDIDDMTAGEESPIRTAVVKSLHETQQKIQQDIAHQVKQQQSALAAMLDPDEPTSPLRGLVIRLDALKSGMEEIRLSQATNVAVVGALEPGVVGGVIYEDLAMSMAQQIAAVAGDDCELTGNVTGRVPRSKMGDAVSRLKVGSNVHAAIVFEAKNKRLTTKDWTDECKGAKENRGATGFIGLCKHIEDMPTASRIFIMRPNEIVLAYDPGADDANLLFLIYHLVRMHCLSEVGELDEISIAEVNQNLDDALATLKKFDQITKDAAAITNSATRIKGNAEELRDTMRNHLIAARRAIRRGLGENALEGHGTEALSVGNVEALETLNDKGLE